MDKNLLSLGAGIAIILFGIASFSISLGHYGNWATAELSFLILIEGSIFAMIGGACTWD